MKKISFIIVSFLLAGLPALAQNLNPEVQVTNDYQTRMADVHKTGIGMSIPDSLTQFKTNIDYSVFPTAYKGAYAFEPYAISMEPESRPFDGSLLYLRAGAGYSFHPVVRAVFTPFPMGLVRNSEYLSFDGYGGKYRSHDTRADYNGHDYGLGAGAIVRWNKETFDFSADAAYKGIYTKDDMLSSAYHKAGVQMNIHSNTPDLPVTYDFDAGFHYGSDAAGTLGRIEEFGYEADGFVCPEIGQSFRLRVDVHSQGSWFGGGVFAPAVLNSAAPKAVYSVGNFTLYGGARIALSEKLTLHPDLSVEWLAPNGAVKVTAALGGGQFLSDYAAFKEKDHWFNASYLTSFKATVERISASLDIRGSLFKHLQYDFSGGWQKLEDSCVQGLAVSGGLFIPGVAYADYEQYWGKALLNWKSERLDVNMDARYAYNTLAKGAAYLLPAAFEMETSAVYNWNRHIFAGLRCRALTARDSNLVHIPGFVDLGLYGEYIFARNLSAWAQAGNLLNAKTAYSPTHVAGGVNFTLGICLKL
ncbi:MAG: hypothetical protein K6F58_06770 [Bacteroidales bacterium]|nr:hypothetical protein [Bacteroidales bacterium]